MRGMRIMRPTRKPCKTPRLYIWRTVSADTSQRSANISAENGLLFIVFVLPIFVFVFVFVFVLVVVVPIEVGPLVVVVVLLDAG